MERKNKTTQKVPDIEPYKSNYGSFQAIRIHQYDLDGHYLKTFNSITEAAKETGLPASQISRCSRGKGRKTHGFQWRIAE